MDKTYLAAIPMVALSAAIGWFARGAYSEKSIVSAPAPDMVDVRKTKVTIPTAENITSAPRGKRSIRESKKISADGIDETKIDEATSIQVRKMMESMAKRQRTLLDQHLDRLDESLGLTAEQKQKLTAWLDEKTKGAGEFDVMAMSEDPEEAYKAQNDFSPEGLEEHLAKILLPDQKEAMESFKHRNKQNKIDALALKNLSHMQGVIEFSDGQRDQVYQILSEEAERRFAETPKTEKMMSFMHEGMGIETDPYDLGIDSIIQDVTGDSLNPNAEILSDTKTMGQKMREELSRRIDRKVELLKPVLNERQLEQYRAHLSSGGGMVEQMIMSMEMIDEAGNPEIPESD